MTFATVDWLIFCAAPLIAWLLVLYIRAGSGDLGTYRGYFLASGRLSTGIVLGAYIGANLTFTSIFLILSEESYRRGWVVFAVPVFWLVGTILFVAFQSRIKKFTDKGLTLHQTLGLVFQSDVLRKWAAFWTIIAFLGTVTLEFYGGILLVSWTGIPILDSIIIAMALAFVVSVFTTSGGMRGVGYADFLLDMFTFASTIILGKGAIALILSVMKGPATQLPTPSVAPPLPGMGESVIFIISMAVLFIPFQFCTLDSWQRLLSWKNQNKSPTWWLLGGGIILAIAFSVPVLIGIGVRYFGALPAGVEPLEAMLHWMALPAGLFGLCLAGLAGAMLSTADELLNCCSLSLIADVWGISFQKERPRQEQIQLTSTGKVYTILFAITAGAFAIGERFFHMGLSDAALAIFSAQVVFSWPLAVAFFTPEIAPRLARSALWAMGLGALTALAFVVTGWFIQDHELTGAAPIAAFIVSGLWFGPSWLRVAKQRKVEQR